jgi:hypothetical protein
MTFLMNIVIKFDVLICHIFQGNPPTKRPGEDLAQLYDGDTTLFECGREC